jgi:hypothetical protein
MDWAEQLISAPASLLLHDAYRVLTTWIGGTSRAQTAAEVLQDDERHYVAETVDLPAAGPDQALSGARRSQSVHPLAAGGGADVGQGTRVRASTRGGGPLQPGPGRVRLRVSRLATVAAMGQRARMDEASLQGAWPGRPPPAWPPSFRQGC